MGFFHCTATRQSDNRFAMKLITALVPLCALAMPCVLKADTFEGTLTMTVTSSDMRNGPMSQNLSLKDGFMRVDINTERGNASMIMDFKNQQMIMLMPQQRMYMVQPLPQGNPAAAPSPVADGSAPAAHTPPPNFQVTTSTETILGYPCTKYVVTGERGTTQIWATDRLGTFMGFYHGGGPGARRAAQPTPEWESAMKGGGFFPMRVISTGPRGTTTMEVTAIQKASLPDSLFAPPDGWRKFDLGGMMGGMGGFPGPRPASDNN
jgi:hypothetical protein